MAAKGTLAEGLIKISLAGYDTIKGQLRQLQAETDALSKAFKPLGDIASQSFHKGTNSVLNFLKAADPVRMMVFETRLKILSMYIGQAFIPILQHAIEIVDKLIVYFSNLSDEQRHHIEVWTEVVLGITGAITALVVAISVVGKISTAIGSLGTVMKLLGNAGPMKLVVILATLAAIIYEVLKASGALTPLMEMLGKVFGGIFESISPILDALDELIDAFLGIGKELLKAFMPIIKEVLSVVTLIAGVIGGVLAEQLKVLTPIIAELIHLFADLIKNLWEAFGPTIIDSIKLVASVVKEVVEFIKDGIEALKDLYYAADSLNPFTDGRPEDTGAGDYRGGTHAGGGGDYGAGDFSKDRGSGGSFDDGKGGSKYKPMQGMREIQTLAVGDVFKKAQAATKIDPTQEYQREHLKETQKGNATLRGIKENTDKPTAAASSF